jgi:hypothetical protein
MAVMTRRIRAIVLTAAALTTLAIGVAVLVSLDQRYYFFYGIEDRAAWKYDLANVTFIGTIMLAAAAIATAALVVPKPQMLAIRCVLALLLLVPWALYSTPFVVHVPGYILVHHLWVWLLIGIMLLVALGSFARLVVLIFRGRRASAI